MGNVSKKRNMIKAHSQSELSYGKRLNENSMIQGVKPEQLQVGRTYYYSGSYTDGDKLSAKLTYRNNNGEIYLFDVIRWSNKEEANTTLSIAFDSLGKYIFTELDSPLTEDYDYAAAEREYHDRADYDAAEKQNDELNELSSDTFKSAIDVSKDMGFDQRTKKLGTLYFHKFIGAPLLGGVISNIETNNSSQSNYRNVVIEVDYRDNQLDGQIKPKDYIYYDIDMDDYGMANYDIERKYAVILAKIALHINPTSKYKEVTKFFKIKGY